MAVDMLTGGAAPKGASRTRSRAKTKRRGERTAARMAQRNGARVAQKRVTIEEWLAIPVKARAELIDGKLVYQALPGYKHGRLQGLVLRRIGDLYDPTTGGGGPKRGAKSTAPGGWWFALEVDVVIAGCGVRPDVAGWRRDKHPDLPEQVERAGLGALKAVPDFICEVLSPSTAHVDQGAKRRAYHRAGVGHYWIVDPANATITVLEHAERDYLVVQTAGGEETLSAPPFEAATIVVSELFDMGGVGPKASTEPKTSVGPKRLVAALIDKGPRRRKSRAR